MRKRKDRMSIWQRKHFDWTDLEEIFKTHFWLLKFANLLKSWKPFFPFGDSAALTEDKIYILHLIMKFLPCRWIQFHFIPFYLINSFYVIYFSFISKLFQWIVWILNWFHVKIKINRLNQFIMFFTLFSFQMDDFALIFWGQFADSWRSLVSM